MIRTAQVFVFSINKLKVNYIFFMKESIYQATTVYNFRRI